MNDSQKKTIREMQGRGHSIRKTTAVEDDCMEVLTVYHRKYRQWLMGPSGNLQLVRLIGQNGSLQIGKSNSRV